MNERGQTPCAQSYGTRRVPTTFNVYLFLEFTIVSDWDDLWVSYAIASLELEIATFSGKSNVRLLNEYYDKIGISFNFTSYQHLTDSINNIVQQLIPLWTEDSIPLNSLSDKAQYIRDLLFLKAHYEK